MRFVRFVVPKFPFRLKGRDCWREGTGNNGPQGAAESVRRVHEPAMNRGLPPHIGHPMGRASVYRPSLLDLKNPFARIRQPNCRIRQIFLGSERQSSSQSPVNSRKSLHPNTRRKTLRSVRLTVVPALLRAQTERRRAARGLTLGQFQGAPRLRNAARYDHPLQRAVPKAPPAISPPALISIPHFPEPSCFQSPPLRP